VKQSRQMRGRLVLCPTPLGNLEDITQRALRALRECDVVVAEDTRVTGKLLLHFGISKPLRSLHEGVESARLREVRALLDEGKTVAIATDAGTPGISDPGTAFVRLAREVGAEIDALPGPSAFVGALVLSGFDVHRFRFDGFPPRKRGERREYVRGLADETAAVALYEAPSRVLELLADIERELPQRRVFVVREYTKRFEQHVLGVARAVAQQIEIPPRGEFTLVLEGAAHPAAATAEVSSNVQEALARLRASGTSARDAVDAVALASGAPRNALYKLALRRKPVT
jgi:16S rRNA (cytidine1402-2'-O)-methyltransferase